MMMLAVDEEVNVNVKIMMFWLTPSLMMLSRTASRGIRKCRRPMISRWKYGGGRDVVFDRL